MKSRRSKPDSQPPSQVLRRYGIAPESAERIRTGHINETWKATLASGGTCVLQSVNPIFPPETQYDIDAVTRELARRGLATTRLIADRKGGLFHEHGGRIWRALTYIEGETRELVTGSAVAAEAGRVLAIFHTGVRGIKHEFKSRRGNVHDLPRHLADLKSALAAHKTHAQYTNVAPVARAIEQLAGELPQLEARAMHVVHGDPKISNVMFERGSDRAICMIDLDTVTRMPVVLELGDAFRSWCNPAAEDSSAASFSLELFEAAWAGYRDAREVGLSAAEQGDLPAAIATIAVELAARFCADALNEAYFGWDSARYASASLHNQARARAQLDLAADVVAQRTAIRRVLGGSRRH